MTENKFEYSLVYHAGLPGRGEFVRLFFEATGTEYADLAKEVGQSCLKRYQDGTFEGSDTNPKPFAPPILVHNDLVISQTPNIFLYLSSRLGPIDLGQGVKVAKAPASLDDPAVFHHHGVLLTLLDFNNEVHDTHHPDVSLYYEDQKEAALAKAKTLREKRVPAFFKNWEANIEKSGSGFLTKEASYADLVLFQIIAGMHYAFPRLVNKIKPTYPRIFELYERVKASPKISAYLASDRRQPFTQAGVYRDYPELDEP